MYTFSMIYVRKCVRKNFNLKKAIKEITDDLRSEAVWHWYKFGPYSNSFKMFSRAHYTSLK